MSDQKFYEMCIEEVFSKQGRKPESDDYETVSKVFEQHGGTWEALAVADAGAWTLLRKVCKNFLKQEKD